ncbi:FAD/FMN-dependent dehydrogenase [Variovorax sp. CF313]|nr:FAD/FMN-dependent dehydrogenase [Variovorax sp. CF313]
MQMKQAAFLEALSRTLGVDDLLVGDAVAARRCSDWSGAPGGLPLALVRPRNTAEVSRVLRLCTEHRVPLVPQGGLTGLAGAALPSTDAVALSLERMNAVEALDAAAGTMTVQAGVTLQSVQEAAAAQGLMFGVDFGARGSCQIGGALSTSAGGNGVLQFGMMREQTLGLEVVLADGRVLPMLRPMLKNNTGYDLKQFFIGAEGTLGVITRALLRLHPAPKARVTALVAVAQFDDALALLDRLRRYFPGMLAAFELMWRDFVQTSLRWQHLREPFDTAYPLLALIDVTGGDEAGLRETLETGLDEAMEAGVARDVTIAQSHAQARAFWTIREATAELPLHMRPPINLDVSLPMASIGRFVDACRAGLDARWPSHRSLFFGHVGDSNLHVTTDGQSIGGEAEVFERMVYAQVEASGGSISAEHGIGLHKKPYLSASRTPAELATMRAIKHALDPLHLLNPGKILDL